MQILGREDLRKQLQAKEFKPLYLLFGEETYLRDLAAKTIADMVMKDAQLRDFNDLSLSLNESDILDALAAAEQLPMMDSRRVVSIWDVRIQEKKENLNEERFEPLSSYLRRPSESSVLIFIADELDKRRRMAKLLLESCTAIEFKPLANNEIMAFAKGKLRELDASISDPHLSDLIGLIGNDARKLLGQLEKLAVAALPDKIITPQLISSLVSNTKEQSNFVLADHLLNKDRRSAVKLLHKILADGAEPLMLLGMIATTFHRILLAKELIAQGLGRAEVAKAAKLPPFRQDEFFASVRRADGKRVSWILERLAEKDLAIKTSMATPGLQVETLVFELTA